MLNARRVKEARLKAGITQTTVDHAIGAPVGTCFRIENKVGTINPDQLTILCDILKVDRTWLLTGDEEERETSPKDRVAEYIKKELRSVMSETGKRVKDIERELGVHVGQTSRYVKGETIPNATVAKRLKEVYGIDIYSVLKPNEYNVVMNSGRKLAGVTEEQKADDAVDEKLTTNVMQIKLWKMTAEMLRLKRQLGNDVSEETDKLISELLEALE